MKAYLVQQVQLGREEPLTVTVLYIAGDVNALSPKGQDH